MSLRLLHPHQQIVSARLVFEKLQRESSARGHPPADALLRAAQALSLRILGAVLRKALDSGISPSAIPLTATAEWYFLGRHRVPTALSHTRELLARLSAFDVLDVAFGKGEEREKVSVRLNPELMIPSAAVVLLDWRALVTPDTRETELVLRLALLERIAPDGEFSRVSKREILRTCGVSYSGLKRAVTREVSAGTLCRRYDTPRDLLLSWGPSIIRER